MGNVVKLGTFHRCPPQSEPSDIIDTGSAVMRGLERDLRVSAGSGTLLEKQEKRAATAIAVIEFEAHRLAALIGIAPAVELLNERIIKRLIEGIQP
jgi:hypothetical protein